MTKEEFIENWWHGYPLEHDVDSGAYHYICGMYTAIMGEEPWLHPGNRVNTPGYIMGLEDYSE
jgi:hypothetical protein